MTGEKNEEVPEKVFTTLEGKLRKRWNKHLENQRQKLGTVNEADEARRAIGAYLDALYGKED